MVRLRKWMLYVGVVLLIGSAWLANEYYQDTVRLEAEVAALRQEVSAYRAQSVADAHALAAVLARPYYEELGQSEMLAQTWAQPAALLAYYEIVAAVGKTNPELRDASPEKRQEWLRNNTPAPIFLQLAIQEQELRKVIDRINRQEINDEQDLAEIRRLVLQRTQATEEALADAQAYHQRL